MCQHNQRLRALVRKVELTRNTKHYEGAVHDLKQSTQLDRPLGAVYMEGG